MFFHESVHVQSKVGNKLAKFLLPNNRQWIQTTATIMNTKTSHINPGQMLRKKNET
jgi:hypothetical protein